MKKASIVGAGCLFYSIATKRYLFLLRDGSKHSGTWGLPGGKVEKDETIIDGLYREVDEEMGSVPEFHKVIPIETFTSNDYKFCYHTFLITVPDEFIPELNDEHRGYAWVNIADHPKPLHPGVWNTFKFEVVLEKLKTIEETL